VDPLAVAGLALVLLVKEAGVPIPVPGDLLVIGAGAAVAGDPGFAVAVLLVILAAGYLGGSVQFLLTRRALRRPLLAMLARVGVPAERVESLAARLRRTGARGVAVARMTPGVRVAAVAASGLAALPFPPFLRGLAVGNAVFVSGHFALGYLVGASAEQLIGGIGPVPLVVAVVALAVLGAVGWWLIRRRRRAALGTLPVAAWTDAACPACLALGAADLLRPGRRAGADEGGPRV
jgi:membrane protein DedA with SNARE-associated domain